MLSPVTEGAMAMNKMNAVNKYRVERWLYLHHCETLAWIVRSFIYLIHRERSLAIKELAWSYIPRPRLEGTARLERM